MTINEISKLAGVSISSVSRVINGKSGVKPDIREKIERIIKENNYTPNLLARSLICKKTNTIGIVLPCIDNYFGESIEAINDFFKKKGYSIMITANSKKENEVDEEIRNFKLLNEKQVDGIIYFVSKYSIEHEKMVKEISNKIPVVAIGKEIKEVNITSVVSDNYESAKNIVKYLIEKGHEKIAFIGGPEYDETANERLRGYKDAMAENKLFIFEELIRPGTFTVRAGKREMDFILNRIRIQPTAVFAINDCTALGAIKAIQENGLKVPKNISVIGFDNIDTSEFFKPSLTTVNHDGYKIGFEAANVLFQRLENEEIEKESRVIKIEQELIERDSVKKIKKNKK